jgi:DnaK suppressor protein
MGGIGALDWVSREGFASLEAGAAGPFGDMTEEELGSYRRVLEALHAELAVALEGAQEQTAPVSPDASIGRLTRQDAMQAQQLALELERRKRLRLAQVVAALRRIDDGNYGICTRCEEEISVARLAVKPEAHQCVRCAR